MYINIVETHQNLLPVTVLFQCGFLLFNDMYFNYGVLPHSDVR
jgi:hypothetical protein